MEDNAWRLTLHCLQCDGLMAVRIEWLSEGRDDFDSFLAQSCDDAIRYCLVPVCDGSHLIPHHSDMVDGALQIIDDWDDLRCDTL
jgi:hypothetical protein